MKRASETAQILDSKVGVGIRFFSELMEFNNGLLAGLPIEEANERYPKPEVIRPHESYYEQETLIEFRARAETILSKIMYEYPSDRIAVVSHGGMINMLFRSFLRLPVSCNICVSTADTGIHLWNADGDNRHIVFANSTKHLCGGEGDI